MNNDWLVWQLVDSAFPSGGFAHSGGLEAAYQAGEARSPEDVKSFAVTSLWSAARGAVPFTIAVCRDVARFDELDARLDLLLNNSVANRASRAQGRALVASCGKAFASPLLEDLRARLRADRTPGHLAVALGGVGAALSLGAPQVARLHLYMVMRSVLSAGVRLSIVGPLNAQALQAECALDAERALTLGLETPVEQAAGASPLIDVVQSTHDRLYSRLFVS